MALYEQLGETGWHLNAMDGLAMTFLADQRYNQATEVLEQALNMLPNVWQSANYTYLQGSLSEHLLEARRGQEHLAKRP
jgi:hypothetical protein